jgi:Cft2 family RNA processing exonuclease
VGLCRFVQAALHWVALELGSLFQGVPGPNSLLSKIAEGGSSRPVLVSCEPDEDNAVVVRIRQWRTDTLSESLVLSLDQAARAQEVLDTLKVRSSKHARL